MNEYQIIISFIIANGATIIGFMSFSFRHLLRYNILLKEFSDLQKEVEKLKKDLRNAFDKIRELQNEKRHQVE